jgi:Flp pilus assembly pilin Flp
MQPDLPASVDQIRERTFFSGGVNDMATWMGKATQLKNRLGQLAKQLHRDESGAMSVEKILILAVISVPILIVLYIFGGKLKKWFSGQDQSLESEMSNQGQTP